MSFPLIHPDDYFTGENWKQEIPREVILFSRNSLESLDSSYLHYHSRYNLITALEGGSLIMMDGESIFLPAGGVLLIHPWQTFRFLYDGDKPIRWLFFGFNWPGDHDRFSKGKVRVFSPFFRQVSQAALDRYMKEGNGPWLVPFLNLLLCELPRLPGHSPGKAIPFKADHSIVLRIQNIVMENLHRPITLGEIAGVCGYSASRLRHIFSRYVGTSLGAYIRQARFNEAAKLLCSTEMSISMLSEECGYSSVDVFSRGFKNHFGIPPLEYRRRFGR